MKEVVIRNRDASLLCKRVAVSFIVFEADDIVTVVGAPSALLSCAEQCSNYCPVADINPITGYVHPPPPSYSRLLIIPSHLEHLALLC